MSWYAIDAVDDAIDATGEFLRPIDRDRWLRLLVVAFFVGGGGSAFNWTQQLSSGPPASPSPTLPGEVAPGSDWLAVAALVVVAAVVLLALATVVVGPVMRFVLLEALHTGAVRIRDPFRRHLGKGLRLLGFTLGIGLLLTTVVAMLFIALMTGGIAIAEQIPDPGTGSVVAVLTVLVGVLVGVGALVAVFAFFHFTTAFVAPTMLVTDRGVFASWSRFYRVLRARWLQFVAYLVMRVVLGIATAVLFGVVGLILLFVVGVVTFVVAFLVAAAFGGFAVALESTAGLAAVGAVVLVGVLVYFVLVSLPLSLVQLTFYTAYELLVLGAADGRLALLGDGGEDRDGGYDAIDDGAGDDGAGPGGFEFGVVESAAERDGDVTADDDAASDDDTGRVDDAADRDADGGTAGDVDGSIAGDADGATEDGNADAEDGDAEDEDDEDDFSTPFWRD